MSNSRKARQEIAQDTLARTEAVVEAAPGASLDSTFIADQLPPLPALDAPATPCKVKVVNGDSFSTARRILREHPDAQGKTSVLNLASDEVRAGGWIHTLAATQEEALCYSSTLYATLKPEYYPWPNLGPGSTAGLYSPAIVIFKDDLDHGCVDLPQEDWRIVSVITVAAPRVPDLTDDQSAFAWADDLQCLREKIRLVYRMAAHNGQEYLVLGAMGCGAYACPPRQVAEEMRACLLEPEFKGRFRHIVFAVYSGRYNPNFAIFKEVFDGVEVSADGTAYNDLMTVGRRKESLMQVMKRKLGWKGF